MAPRFWRNPFVKEPGTMQPPVSRERSYGGWAYYGGMEPVEEDEIVTTYPDGTRLLDSAERGR